MLLPWEYGVRNLARRPLRTALTLIALTTVVSLMLIVIGFIRGLERSLSVSGDPEVVLVFSLTAEDNPENSAISANVPELLAASVEGISSCFGNPQVSAELYLATRVSEVGGGGGFGLVRGVTDQAPQVRRGMRLTEGSWPGRAEVLVGRLAATKLGQGQRQGKRALGIGEQVEFEGQTWTISGQFEADGATYESEIWCRLEDLQLATKRQDLSLVALLLGPQGSLGEVDLFCKERLDLELSAVAETEYYQGLQQFYRPVRWLAWAVVWMVAGAGIFTGLNMMYGAVAGRIREMATLRAIGFRRRAVLVGLMQEGMLLAAAAALLAGSLALLLVDGLAVKFTMGAFRLRIDSVALLIGFGIGMLLGVFGAIPPGLKALSAEIANGLKSNG
jgi:putative ABC transport system permease protein